jgi:hypothetical protein
MSYRRVIPRDLFNEANLLKCLGQLALATDIWLDVKLDHNGLDRFDIHQDPSDGSIFVNNLAVFVHGQRIHVSRPLNSRESWPLYAQHGDDVVPVFDRAGALSDEFEDLIASIGRNTDG